MKINYIYQNPNTNKLTRGTLFHSNGEFDQTLSLSVVDSTNKSISLKKEDIVVGKTFLVKSKWRPNAVAAYNIFSHVVMVVKPIGKRDEPLDAVLWIIQVTELSPTVEFFNGEPVTLQLFL